MKVSDYIVGYLNAQGVTCAFEVVGGMIAHLVDSFDRDGRVPLISVHHEQAASFAADAYGRMTGRPGMAMATSGPGAINLLTGLGGAYFDSSPAIFITGQVNRAELKGDRPIRQLGFQEADIVAMARPIAKGAWQVKSPDEVEPMLKKAVLTAISGRPGPVLLDIPMDIQSASIDPEIPFKRIEPDDAATIKPAPGQIDGLLDALGRAQKPLIVAGGGIHGARALDAFRKFVIKAQIPVVNSLMAVDALPYADPLRVGMLGSYGNRWTNLLIGEADLLLVLGSRLDIRQTGADTRGFKGERVMYHVDCEAGEMNNRVTGCQVILSHLAPFFAAANERLKERPMGGNPGWMKRIADVRAAWPDTAEIVNNKGINPNQFMHELSRASALSRVFIADVGQHQMWAAQSLELLPNQRFLTSGGMGAMGFALPAALGAQMADPDSRPVVIAGDGGFQLNIQELQTIYRNNFPIKMVVINNQCHGMVRQFQESYFNARYRSTLTGYSAPDFAAVAQAYGISAKTISAPDQVSDGLAALWADPDKPFLLQVAIDTFANAYPKIAFGKPMTEMEPHSKPIEMEGT